MVSTCLALLRITLYGVSFLVTSYIRIKNMFTVQAGKGCPSDLDTRIMDFSSDLNVSQNITNTRFDSEIHKVPIWTMSVVCSLSLIGTVGNALVCYVIGRTRKLHNTTNYLIVNLAIADLLVCVLSTLKPIVDQLEVWPSTTIGRILFCVLLNNNACIWLSSLISACALVLLSFERFIGVVYPLQYHNLVTSRRLKIAILFQWCLPSIFEALWLSQISVDEELALCNYTYITVIYGVVYITGNHFIPVVSLVYLYGRMFRSIRESNRPQINRSNHNHGVSDRQRARKNVLMNLFIITILFMIFVTPSTVLTMCSSNILPWRYHTPTLNRVSFILLQLNSVVNPFVFALRYKRFRKALRSVLFRRSRSSQEETKMNTMNGNRTDR